uniref:Retrovirus-related Pol polyprotein from transposon TNT 1-94-like beta-barrel domain-containing protein n=1 Tax=Brassica oleracea var. oleracea TaxID=109376 RepID=A0A0D3E471_BRAOL
MGTQKLKFNDVRDRILAEEVRRIDSGEASTSSAFNNCRAPPEKEDNIRGGANVVTREIADALVVSVDSPRKIEAGDATANTTKASISYVDSPVDSWVLDSGASFRTAPHHNIMENYVAGNYGKVYLADGLPLDIVGIGDINLKMSDGRVWKITKPGESRKVPWWWLGVIEDALFI